MQLSWSHKLFLRINSKLGQNIILDKFMRFCGKWLIYVLAITIVVWIVSTSGQDIFSRILFFSIFVVASYMVSLLVGVVVKKPRPEIEMPEIKQLVHTIGLWKSFPSDHTNISFLLVILSIFFGIPVFLYVPLLFCAALIAVGRVYCGVHYPRDIVGGIVLALLTSTVAYLFII